MFLYFKREKEKQAAGGMGETKILIQEAWKKGKNKIGVYEGGG